MMTHAIVYSGVFPIKACYRRSVKRLINGFVHYIGCSNYIICFLETGLLFVLNIADRTNILRLLKDTSVNLNSLTNALGRHRIFPNTLF